MKFLEKMKNLFTEEVEEVVEEKPIKKEVKQVEIPSPVKHDDVKPIKHEENNISDSVVVNNAEKVRTPIYFDDKDFADLRKPERKVEEVKPKVKPVDNTPKPYQPVIQEKKVFKPSPIISPVYGVLDQNYTKEDIVPKRESSYYKKPEHLTIDDVRQKAFGTLEDELEDTLYGRGAFLNKNDEFDDIDKELDNLDKKSEPVKREEYHASHEKEEREPIKSDDDLALEIEKQKAKLDEINKYIKSNVDTKEEKTEEKVVKHDNDEEKALDGIDNKYEVVEDKTEVEKELDSLEEEIKKDISLNNEEKDNNNKEIEEGDLFNLIDSMYEKGE